VRRRAALSRVVASAGFLLLAGGCSALFDESGLRGDGDSSGSGGRSGSSSGGSSNGGSSNGGSSNGGSSNGGSGGVGGGGDVGGASGDASGGTSGVGGGLAGDPYGALIQSDGPIAYYRFEGADGGSTPNLIEGSPEATLIGAVEIVPPGAVGSPGDGALNLDGQGFAVIDKLTGLSLNDEFTLELWFSFEPASNLQNACLLSVRNDAGGGIALQASLDFSGDFFRVDANLFGENGEGSVVSVQLSSPPITFTYLAASLDGDTLTICVGDFRSSFQCRGTQLSGILRPNNVTQIGVGNDTVTPTCPLLGQIDELAIYDEALDEGTLRGHFAASDGLPFDPGNLPF
jgi:Concanavalin A-like lectin/glucanases superfamily